MDTEHHVIISRASPNHLLCKKRDMVCRIIIIMIQCRMEKMKNSLEEKRHGREKWNPAAFSGKD